MYKKVFACLLAIALLAGALSGCAISSEPQSKTSAPSASPSAAPSGSSQKSGEATVVKLGYGGALTGGSAEQGTRQWRAMQMAIEEYNAQRKDTDPLIELVALDDKADPKESATVASKLASDPAIIGVIGHTNSSCTLAAAPIYNQNKLCHITTGSSSPAITKAGDYTFRTWNSDRYTASFNTKTLLELGYKKLGIIYENNDYGVGGYEVSLETMKAAGIEPLVAEAYLLGETKDFSTLITKLKDAGVEAIFAVSDETELGLFAAQSAQQNYHPLVASSGTYNPTVIEIGGKAAEGMMGSTPFNPSNLTPGVAAFYERFFARYKADNVTGTENSSPPAYIGANVLIDAVKAGCKTREDVKNYLTGLTWESIVGTLTFDENGDIRLPLVMMEIKDGKFVEAKFQPSAK